jgi:hypothetical protein
MCKGRVAGQLSRAEYLVMPAAKKPAQSVIFAGDSFGLLNRKAWHKRTLAVLYRAAAHHSTRALRALLGSTSVDAGDRVRGSLGGGRT